MYIVKKPMECDDNALTERDDNAHKFVMSPC